MTIDDVSILDREVSLFKGSYDTSVTETLPLGTVLDRIQHGHYAGYVKQLRQTLTTKGEKAYQAEKEHSIAFTLCCSLTTRDKDRDWKQRLLACTWLVQLDCDKLDDPEALKAALAQNPHVAFVFTSPRGNGLKVGIAATPITDDDTYKHAWAFVVQTMQETYPGVHINIDTHVKFLHALCYMSHVPALYRNAD